MATADTVIIKPGIVLRQPTTSIRDAGQNTCIQSLPVAFACRTPATPNHSSVSTAPEIARPNNAPMSNTVRFATRCGPSLYGPPIDNPPTPTAPTWWPGSGPGSGSGVNPAPGPSPGPAPSPSPGGNCNRRSRDECTDRHNREVTFCNDEYGHYFAGTRSTSSLPHFKLEPKNDHVS